MKNIILLNSSEAWANLTDLCREKKWSYNYLKRLTFPINYKGNKIERLEIKR